MKYDLFDTSSFFAKNLWKETSFLWEPLASLQSFFQNPNLYLSNSFHKICPEKYPGVFFKNPESIFIQGKIEIEPGAFIEGPCFIDDTVQIKQGAYIKGFVLLGKGCVVGHASEIKRSILLNKARAAHFNYIGDSIVGNEVNVGAGVVCANFRLDKGFITVKDFSGNIQKTSLKKLGSFIGDFSSIGCNSVINPGTVIEKNSKILPLSLVQGSSLSFRKKHEVETRA